MHAQGLAGLGTPREAADLCLELRELRLERDEAVVADRDEAVIVLLVMTCDRVEVGLVAIGGRADGRVVLA